jgi:predicted dehydrogenase
MAAVCNIAMIGQKLTARAHCNAFLKVPRFFNLPLQPVMYSVVGADLISLAPFADRWGWRKYSTAWKEAIKDPAVNLVDITGPNHLHAEQAVAAISAGKHVACEKPLADSLKNARLMRNAAVRSRTVKSFVWFNYRRVPAVSVALQLIREGRLRKIRHVRASFLQNWGGADAALSWRFQKKYAGSGAHGELNAQLIDLARFLTGSEFIELTGALNETLIVERALPEPPGRNANRIREPKRRTTGKSDVDDTSILIGRMTGGVLARLEASRVAAGHQNDLSIEIDGDGGAIRFDLYDMNALRFYDGQEDRRTAGWRRIVCTAAGKHPYAGAWWSDGQGLGYEHTYVHMAADMFASLGGEQPATPLPDFADAYETQRVLEAAMLAAKHRAAVKLTEIK